MKAMIRARACSELEDLLLSKEVWLAVIGIVVALNQWLGWEVPLEVFAAVEILIIAVIAALSKK